MSAVPIHEASMTPAQRNLLDRLEAAKPASEAVFGALASAKLAPSLIRAYHMSDSSVLEFEVVSADGSISTFGDLDINGGKSQVFSPFLSAADTFSELARAVVPMAKLKSSLTFYFAPGAAGFHQAQGAWHHVFSEVSGPGWLYPSLWPLRAILAAIARELEDGGRALLLVKDSALAQFSAHERLEYYRHQERFEAAGGIRYVLSHSDSALRLRRTGRTALVVLGLAAGPADRELYLQGVFSTDE